MAIVTLEQKPSRAICGGKFAGLAAACEFVPVPQAICLTTDEFEHALGTARLRALARLMEDLRATVGAFFLEANAEVAAIFDGLSLATFQRQLLAEALERIGWARARLAVRSSAVEEDGANASNAGIYTSILDVAAGVEVERAIVACWRSFYGPAALAARVRARDFDARPRMAVVVQEMVEPEIAGVAFTDHDRLIAEYVHGRADTLVAGSAQPERITISCCDSPALGPGAPFLEALRAAVLRLKLAASTDVDVEWAWAAGSLWILQCRPVSAPLVRGPSQTSYFAAARLYHDEVLPDGFSLGAVAEVYADYVAKRAIAYRLACHHDIRTGAAFVVSLNRAALAEKALAQRLDVLLEQCAADQVVLDVAPTIRQIVTDRRELPGRLRMLLGTADGLDRQGCIIREYLRGSHGALSMPDSRDGYLVEISSEGLLALNRGTAACTRLRISGDCISVKVDGEAPEEVRSALPAMVDFTNVLNAVLGDVQLEWVIVDGHAVFVDYSATAHEVPHNRADDRTVVICGGVARGPVVEIGDDALLERLSTGPAVSVGRSQDVLADRDLGSIYDAIAASSEKPIVVARAPYAALSILIDRVAGFVFEQGAVLSHLGIILRESRLPAIIHPDPPRSGTVLIADGSMHVMTDGSSQ